MVDDIAESKTLHLKKKKKITGYNCRLETGYIVIADYFSITYSNNQNISSLLSEVPSKLHKLQPVYEVLCAYVYTNNQNIIAD